MALSYEVIDHPRYRYRLTRALKCQMRHYDDLAHPVRLAIDGQAWITLDTDGELWIARGYAYDGASGPAIDTMSMALAAAVHDAGYNLIAAGLLPIKPWKGHFDREFKRLMRDDGVPWWRRQYAFLAVRLFGRARDRFNPDGLHRRTRTPPRLDGRDPNGVIE